MMALLDELLQSATISEAVYTPSELERISGLSVEMQRVWRQRGQLPSLAGGHARFTVAEVVEITIRTALSRAGVSPGEQGIDLKDAAKAVKSSAVFAQAAIELNGPAPTVDSFYNSFENDRGTLGRLLAGNPPEASFLVLNDQRDVRIVDNSDDLIRDTEEIVFIYNLRRLGSLLIIKGRKPFLLIKWSKDKNRRNKKRLTGI